MGMPASRYDDICSDDPSERRRWLSDLYEANAGAVFRLCCRLLKSPEDAADATHEVFLRAITSLPIRSTVGLGRAWLMTVARNHCLDVLRRRKRLGSALALLAADGRGAPNCDVAVIDRQLLAAVLHELGKRDRLVLWQSAVERRPLGEIASYLGLSYMAAAQLRHRARTRASMIAARLAALLGILASHQLRRSAEFTNVAQSMTVAALAPVVAAAFVTFSAPPTYADPQPAANSVVLAPLASVASVSAGVPSPSWFFRKSTATASSGAEPGRTRKPLAEPVPLTISSLQRITGQLKRSAPVLPRPRNVIPSPKPPTSPIPPTAQSVV